MKSALKNKDEYINYMINEYADMVYRIAYTRTNNKQDSEDIFQEVYLKLAKRIPNFKNKEHEKAWMIRVTINCSKNFLSSSWNKKTVGLDDNIPFETKESYELYSNIAKLSVKYRTVIYLYYYEGFKINEISKILKTNESTVKTRLSRAKENLKNIMRGDDVFED